MELNLDEQKLLADLQRLPSDGKQELFDYAAILVRKYQKASNVASERPANQCSLGKQAEVRPETVKEPIFTE
jgi:hypothetical protein